MQMVSIYQQLPFCFPCTHRLLSASCCDSFCVFNKESRCGLQYYADYGSITSITSLHDQQQIFPAIDLNVSPKWDTNFGVGAGSTAATDHWIVKAIIGRRFDRGPRHNSQ